MALFIPAQSSYPRQSNQLDQPRIRACIKTSIEPIERPTVTHEKGDYRKYDLFEMVIVAGPLAIVPL